MKIHIISIGKTMPSFVNQGFEEYRKRMPREFEIVLHEISAIKRGSNANCAAIKQQESLKLLEKIPTNCYRVALDSRGKKFNTEKLATLLDDFYQHHQNLALLIGGPEGLSQECINNMQQIWSLSDLTLSHTLVRVVLAEQLYRAMTIIKGLPYHR